ncbi:MAG: glycogen debranching N-terminal domain-containing protein, partial [bacterium]|nr:glycogen debranching N-terminal domain-containing protein [bacterium]
MEGLQPLLHHLVCTLSAPVQAWSERDGQIREDGAQGIYLSDRRTVARAVLSSSTHQLEHLNTEMLSHDHTLFVHTARTPAGAIDPEVLLVRGRLIEGGALKERLLLRNASAADVTIG